MSYHGHSFIIETPEAHSLEGITSFASDNKNHRHRLRLMLLDEKGDTKNYLMLSSLEIPSKEGGHTHFIEGVLKDSRGNDFNVNTTLLPY